MYVESIDSLDDLSDNELWEVAASTRNTTEIRHEAIQRWLFPENGDPEMDGGRRLRELRRRASVLPRDEVEEDDIEELERTGPYFDGEGRLIVEYNGKQYLINSREDDDDEDAGDDEIQWV